MNKQKKFFDDLIKQGLIMLILGGGVGIVIAFVLTLRWILG